MATCPDCGGAMLTERPHRHPTDDRAALAAPAKHEHDETRCDQPNIWFGGDTCECVCGCRFLSVGHPSHPLCPSCEKSDDH